MKRKSLIELGEILEDYDSIPKFIEKYKEISIPEFDYYTVNKLSLFLVRDNYDFDTLEQILAKIDYTLPSIKRIFAKPIIHLKEEDEVLPVEAVKLINNNTINHISTHSELWDDYTSEGIKPTKLLTRTYKDNYSIYENVVFAKSVDCVLSYLRKNIRDLRNLMYSSKVLEMNILERVNHLNYYLAIGKLHTGYIRNFSKSYDIAKAYNDKMSLMYDTICARLKRNVYKLNKNYNSNFELHNSNILLMQKDYHRVYNLLKYFKKIKEEPYLATLDDLKVIYGKYLSYLKIITLFRAIHFNFEANDDAIIRFDDYKLDLKYNDFKLSIKEKTSGISLEFNKNKPYKIFLSPFGTMKPKGYDEIINVSPIAIDSEYKFISILDVESFRRLQQILFKGMIYSDLTFDTCMFCGNSLKNISSTDVPFYLCKSCRTTIEEKACNIDGKKYYKTGIDGYKFVDEKVFDNSELLHYRNITNITKGGEIICPYCNKVHN